MRGFYKLVLCSDYLCLSTECMARDSCKAGAIIYGKSMLIYNDESSATTYASGETDLWQRGTVLFHIYTHFTHHIHRIDASHYPTYVSI